MSPTSHLLSLTDLVARVWASRAAVEGSPRTYWATHRREVADVPAPIDRAVLGGAAADRVAWAFLAGYQAALCALVPSHEAASLAAFCASEAGGAHPRAILSELRCVAAGGRVLSGHKRWATTVPDVDVLFVVAREGQDAEGRPRLRVARLDPGRAGVRVEAMAPPPFVPEVPHGEVFLTDVAVAERELLPGDGYASFVKPFRTLEDLHVNAPLLGYLLGVARQKVAPPSLIERLLVAIVTVRALACEDVTAPATHVSLAGLLTVVRGLTDEVVAHLAPLTAADARAEHARLVRDAVLFGVASKAREQRRVKAWAALGADPTAPLPVRGQPEPKAPS